jgi:hypothetical protein
MSFNCSSTSSSALVPFKQTALLKDIILLISKYPKGSSHIYKAIDNNWIILYIALEP